MTRSLRRLKRRPPLSRSVQNEIKAYVVENRLRPGDSLPSEAKLAEQLGVSRNSVREAVKSLETLGLLEARVGSGLYVGNFSLDVMLDFLPFDIAEGLDFAQAFSARQYLELGMAEDLLGGERADAIGELHDILRQWKTATERNEYLPELDLSFHRTLSESVGNHVASRLVELLWEVRNRAQAIGVIQPPPDLGALYDRHVAIVEALEARDMPAYRAAIQEHYADVAAPASGARPTALTGGHAIEHF
jgi:DNA-binding FadR family transcriptional regulator